MFSSPESATPRATPEFVSRVLICFGLAGSVKLKILTPEVPSAIKAVLLSEVSTTSRELPEVLFDPIILAENSGPTKIPFAGGSTKLKVRGSLSGSRASRVSSISCVDVSTT